MYEDQHRDDVIGRLRKIRLSNEDRETIREAIGLIVRDAKMLLEYEAMCQAPRIFEIDVAPLVATGLAPVDPSLATGLASYPSREEIAPAPGCTYPSCDCPVGQLPSCATHAPPANPNVIPFTSRRRLVR